ncbi:MAG: hypothetical protein RL380_1779 [Verrucomicrobiota bacterium]|jgi:ferric-dicitrate binding protein FerR (iron transport regulator)
MKLTKLFALAAALCLVAVTASAASNSARVSRIQGKARYSTDNKNFRDLTAGDILKPGTVIQTASESWVDVVLYDDAQAFTTVQPVVRKFNYGIGQDAQQNVIRLRENTVLALDKLFSTGTGSDSVTETQLDLRAGRVFGNVKKLSGASKYEVKLPNGVAGIRGTLFDLSANGVLTVYFGSVAISYYDGTGQLVTKVVYEGERLDLNTNQLTHLSGNDNQEGQHEGDQMGHDNDNNNNNQNDNGSGAGAHDPDPSRSTPSPVNNPPPQAGRPAK